MQEWGNGTQSYPKFCYVAPLLFAQWDSIIPPEEYDWFGFVQDLEDLIVQGGCDIDTLATKFSETTPCEVVALDACFADYPSLIGVLLNAQAQNFDLLTPSYTRIIECYFSYVDEIHKQ